MAKKGDPPVRVRIGVLLLFALWSGLIEAASPVRAQPAGSGSYLLRAWTTAEGLPASFVGDLAQTPDGYLWLATGGGLVRFDGIDFRTYDELPGWMNHYVNEVFADSRGTLWLTSGETLDIARFDGVRFLPGGSEAGLPDVPFVVGLEDRRGRLWLFSEPLPGRYEVYVWDGNEIVITLEGGGKKSLLFEDEEGVVWGFGRDQVFRVEGDEVTYFSAREGLPGGSVRCVTGSGGAVWVVTEQGMAVWDGHRFAPFPRPLAGRTDLLRERTWGCRSDRSGTVWLFSDGDLVRLRDGRVERVRDARGQPILIRGIGGWYEGRDGTLWVGTIDGRLLHGRGRRFERIALQDLLPVKVVNRVFGDAEGNVWVATDAGLIRVTARKFPAYTPHEGLSEAQVYTVYEDRRGTIWVGTWGGGLNRIEDGRVTAVYTTRDGLPDDYVRALHEDRQGTLWIGTRDALARLVEGKISVVHAGIGYVNDILEDRDGNLWYGSDGYLACRCGDSVRVLREGFWTGRPATVRVLHEDRNGNLWAGTHRGLVRHRNGAQRVFTTADGLPSNYVLSIHEEDDGTLWLGTFGAGLVRWKNGAFFTFTTEHGLHSDGVWQILEDSLGHFWMSSYTGVFRVRRAELDAVAEGRQARLTSVVYTEADGLPSAECTRGHPGGWRSRDGRLWFPTMRGLVVIDPDDVPVNDRPPPVHVQSVRAGGVPLGPPFPDALAPDRRNLEFHYTALSFVAPEKNRYRYRLEGYDRTWVEAGTRRYAAYTNLSPGTYTFRVIAANNDGVWNEAGAAYRFRIRAAWHESWWFRGLLAMLLGLIVALTAGYRKKLLEARRLNVHLDERARALREEQERTEVQARQLADQAERLQEMDRLKRRFFANLSHEFRTPLTLIRGPVDDLLAGRLGPLDERVKAQLRVVSRNTRNLERLIAQLLDLARLEAGSLTLSARRGDLARFAEEVVAGCAPLAERRDVRLSFRAAVTPLTADFDPDKLEKVLVNLLSNAIKFTPAGGKVQVDVEGDDAQVLLRVRDTGIGIPADELPRVFDRFHQVAEPSRQPHEGVGIGLSLVKELVELHGGEVLVESTAGFGSTFTVRLPRRQPGVCEDGEEPHPSLDEEPLVPAYAVEEETMPPGAGDGGAVPESEVAKREDAVAGERPVVLLVEDNPDVRAYLRRHLASAYRVEEAGDGYAALEAVQAQRPDLILCDVMMPGMDGYALCRRFKADDRFRDIPVILLTARAEEADAVEGLDAGADDYVRKPFEVGELLRRVHHLIARRRDLQARYRRELVIRPTDVVVASEEEQFIARAREVVERYLDEPGFTVDRFAEEMNLSRSQLNRRLSAATGLSAAALVRHLRLERAAQLLGGNGGRVSEVARAVGFNDVDHFSRLFKAHFGVSPSEYRANGA
ncbi:MAG: hybrid sensor histidine kinase/response regulator [Rhodothermaceae bacterium]|nr:MAG: hybrid sensor histidine kinase/response regulator [Rhodothermaceae bacterium]